MLKTPEQVVAELEATGSRKGKEAIVAREARATNDVLFEGFRYAFDPMITFGVAKVPAHDGKSNKQLSWPDFKHGLEQLRDSVTGHAARDLILDLMHNSNPKQWDGWYRRILLKDMKAGFTQNTINRVVYGDWVKKKWVAGIAPKYRIVVFECQLATDSADCQKYMRGKKQIDTKMDGNRCLTVIWPAEKRVTQFSRTGKEMVNFPTIVKQLEKVVDTFDEPTVIDAEIMSASFQDLMRQVHRKSNVQTNDANLMTFDIVPLDKFLEGLDPTPQHKRAARLEKWYNKYSAKLPNVRFLENETIDLDTKEGWARLEELRIIAGEAGAEGIMVKDVNAGYECKRGKNWLKIKPNITVDLKIIGAALGEKGTKNEHRLGALMCEGKDKGKHILVSVGGGFSDAQREDFWKKRNQLMGQTVEVCADAITKSDDKATYSLRFPRFERFRDDK